MLGGAVWAHGRFGLARMSDLRVLSLPLAMPDVARAARNGGPESAWYEPAPRDASEWRARAGAGGRGGRWGGAPPPAAAGGGGAGGGGGRAGGGRGGVGTGAQAGVFGRPGFTLCKG